ncbi:MAG: hypothetical protein BAA04_13460 [Firmicutes bacterium ZCTH02-B6]|nr:MAG: hypothetical protein BAA04_13460 [Firmicutes bacterium ZCTH02-B6]
MVKRACVGFSLVLIVLLLLGNSGPAMAQLAFDIPAEIGLLMEASTGRILWAKNPEMQTEPASLAKLMTMLLVYEAVENGIATWNDRVVASPYAASVGGSTAMLAPGESFTLLQMLKAIAIQSANDASVAVAEHLAGSEPAFVAAMNAKARELGMTSTRYVNADGLPVPAGAEPNLTTARDVATLARTLITKYPQVLELTSTWQETLREAVGNRPRFDLINTNRLILRYPGADGLKTGWTEAAGYNLVATAQRNGVRLISVVMRAESDEARVSQSARILDYGFNNFGWYVVLPKGQSVGSVRLPDGVQEQLPVRAGEDLHAFLHRADVNRVTYRVIPRDNLSAPVAVDEVVGEIVAYVGDEEVGRVAAIAAADMGRANFFVRTFRWLRDLVSGRE